MRTIDTMEARRVGGGDEAEVDANIGRLIATVLHSLSSDEAIIGGMLCPLGGMIIGAIVHQDTKH